MKRVREIAEAIGRLSPEEHRHLIEWFEQQHWRHAASSRVEEAHAEEDAGGDAPSAEGSGAGKAGEEHSGGAGEVG